MLRPRCSFCFTALLIGGGLLLVGNPASAQEIENAASTEPTGATNATVGSDGVLYDNGPPNLLNGYHNGTEGAYGARRTLLDDFVVPPGQQWTLRAFRWQHLWNTLPAGSGIGAEFFLRGDDLGVPAEILLEAAVTSYSESATGDIFFDRPAAESWINMDPITLSSGTYWFEAAIIGAESNFWLTADVMGTPCWVNYSDFNGLEPGVDRFGEDSDLNFQLLGDIGCPADIDGNLSVGFGDLEAILAAWGPCEGCPEDLDENGFVAMPEILRVLAAWGPCPIPGMGACCLLDGTCVEDTTPSDCEALGGNHFAFRTCAVIPCLGACCFDDGTCEDLAAESECESAGGLFRGPGSTCAIDCEAGACCFDDGTCIAAIVETCATMGGTYEGDGSTCEETCLGACCFEDGTCEDAVVESVCVAEDGFYRGDGSRCLLDCIGGACCFDDGTCLDEVIVEACGSMGGTYRGDGSTCAVTCLGACCFFDATCDEATAEGECLTAGGFFRGAGSTCAASCRTGACCFEEATCTDGVIGEACEAMGGAYRGDDTTCAAECPFGACCLDDACIITIPEDCAAVGGTYQGEGTSCATRCNLSSDDCANAIVVGDGEHYYLNLFATTDGPDLPPECDEGRGLGFEKDVWFRYQASCDGTATANVCASSIDTRMAVYEDGDCPGPFIACNDDACGGGNARSRVFFAVEVGEIYLIRIGTRDGAAGLGTLVIECHP